MRPEVGERRSVKITYYFTVPWDFPEERIPFDTYIKRFIERNEKEGWRLERVLRVWRDPAALLTADAHGRRVYNIDGVFSRPARRLVLDVPDRIVEKLVETGKFKLME